VDVGPRPTKGQTSATPEVGGYARWALEPLGSCPLELIREKGRLDLVGRNQRQKLCLTLSYILGGLAFKGCQIAQHGTDDMPCSQSRRAAVTRDNRFPAGVDLDSVGLVVRASALLNPPIKTKIQQVIMLSHLCMCER
jgi:hypothetical protein